MPLNMLSNWLETWKRLTVNQKTALGASVVVMAVIVAVAVSMMNAPQYRQLYGNMTDEDAAQVVQKLKEKKIKYRLIEGGRSIEVPAEQVDDLHLELAASGLPQGGNNGFALFDKTVMGESQFGERVKYQRALQGELERTIGLLKPVRRARVTLVLPERQLYTENEKQPSASVMVDLREPSLSPKEVKSIIYLVKSAVEGLTPEQVTVVDTNSNLLSDSAGVSEDTLGSQRMQAQRAAETQVEQRVQSLADTVLGLGKAIVRASVSLNFDKKQTDVEEYKPLSDSSPNGVVTSAHNVREDYNGGKKNASGIPGAQPNAVGNLTGGAGGDQSYVREENSTEYSVSKRTERVTTYPGSVEKICLSMFVDDSVKNDQLKQPAFEQAIAAAAGLNAERGDIIKVLPMTFDNSAQKAEETTAKQRDQREMYMGLVKTGGAVIMIVLFLFILMRIYRSAMPPVTAHILPEEEVAPLSLELPPMTPERAIEAMPLTSPAFEDEEEQLMIRDEYKLHSLDPQRIAQIIKVLLTDEA